MFLQLSIVGTYSAMPHVLPYVTCVLIASVAGEYTNRCTEIIAASNARSCALA